MWDCMEGVNQWEDGGKKSILRGEEDWDVLHIYIYEDSIMKTSKHCLKKWGRSGIMKG
jgi:hypothetical protein